MITLVTGDNSYRAERLINIIVEEFDGDVLRVDSSAIDLKNLPDLLMGATLFSSKRLVIIKNLSDNKDVWARLNDWVARISSDIHLVLIEPKVDKRTATYKNLKKVANVVEAAAWAERDTAEAEAWVIDEAARQGAKLDRKCAQVLVRRVGLDQWRLFHAVAKLALVREDITTDIVESLTDANPVENVFNLFEAALGGQSGRMIDMIRNLELTEDPYRLFGLLSGQAFQLAAVCVAGQGDNVAKDFGVHPYAVSKLEQSARKISNKGAAKIIRAFATADDDMKLSRADPWLLIERALMQVANI